jgi:hypothetical protein
VAARAVASLSKPVANAGKLLSVAALNKVSAATMTSKTSGDLPVRAKPWDYRQFGFGPMWALVDGTTKRFNENSKLIVVGTPRPRQD